MRFVVTLLGAVAAALGAAAPALADFTPGNILVTHEFARQIREYTPQGQLVQSVYVPYPPGGTPPITEYLRDLVQTPNGDIFIYNGTYDPYLSRRSAEDFGWTHRQAQEWNTYNNTTVGGIAYYDNWVFATDTRISQEGPLQEGIVRFDANSNTWVRFATYHGFIDVNVGLDGKVYAKESVTTPEIWVFDPVSLELERRVWLNDTSDIRAVAVNEAGEIFVCGSDRYVRRYSPEGGLLDSLWIGQTLADLDLRPDGQIVGMVTYPGSLGPFLTDESLDSFTHFVTLNAGRQFVAWVIPEPTTLIGLLLAVAVGNRRSRRETPRAARPIRRRRRRTRTWLVPGNVFARSCWAAAVASHFRTLQSAER